MSNTLQVATYTQAEIEAKVNGSNSFTKMEISVYRKEITAARKARKLRLMGMSRAENTAMVAGIPEGAKLIKAQEKTGERSQRWTMVWEKKLDESASAIKAKLAKLDEQKKELEEQLSKAQAPEAKK